MVSKLTWDKLNKLSKNELLKLMDICEVGLLNNAKALDKDELILILQTEPEFKVKSALKKLLATK